MYDASRILSTDGLYTRIGLKEPTKTGYTGILDASAKTTKSGRTYDFYHSLANFVNIYDCQEDIDITNAEVNALIAQWQKDAINTVLKRIFNESDLIENALLYKNANTYNDLITNNGKFVGLEIEVPDTDTIVNVLNSVILQFNGVVTFNLYLFHSSVSAAIDTTSCATLANTFKKVELANSLYAQYTTYGPGKFYLGYFQNDLGGVQAYNRVWDNSPVQTRFKCAKIRPIQVTPNGTSLFDIKDVEYVSQTWGLNLDVSSYQDHTNKIMSNLALFDDAQGIAFAIRILELIKTTGRINVQRVNQKLPEIAAFELESQTSDTAVKTTGMYAKLAIEINRVRKTFFDDSKIIVTTA